MPLNIIVSTIQDGSMKSIHETDIHKTNKSRNDFLIRNNIDPKETTLVRIKYQGADYKRYLTADDTHKGNGITFESTIDCDAIVVSDYNHALFLPLADCIGAVLYDDTKNIIMVSHLGRHSLQQQGGFESVNYLKRHFNIDPKNLKIWISPAAGKASYPLFNFNNRSLHEVAFEQLINAGALPENIELSSIDTTKNKDYYSHSQFLKGNRIDDGRFAIVACMTKLP